MSVIKACRIGAGSASPLDTIKRCAGTLIASAQQFVQGFGQVDAHLAAQAAGGECDDIVFALFDQLVIEPDFTELVDNDGGARKRGLAQQMAEQCGLAAAEKASEHRNWGGYRSRHDGTKGEIATRTRLAA